MITKSDLKVGAQFYLRNPFNTITIVKILKDRVYFISKRGQEIATYCTINEAIDNFKKVEKND